MKSAKWLWVAMCVWTWAALAPGEELHAWQEAVKGAGEREAVAAAIGHVREKAGWKITWSVEHQDIVAALTLMEVMTSAELEEFREAFRAEGCVEDPEAWAKQFEWQDQREGWAGIEAQLRLAQLQERGEECGEEGQALAARLERYSIRGAVVGLKRRMTEDGGSETADEGRGDRWRGWCEAMWGVTVDYVYPGNWRKVWDEDSSGWLAPWLDCIVQRPLREALTAWGGKATEEERAAVEKALEELAERAPEKVLEGWRASVAETGAWAEAALERGEETARKREARLAELEAKRWEWSEEEHKEWRRLVELD